MDLDQLQSVRDRERQTDRLQQLRESFYEDAGDFVADLRAERDAAADEAEDPFDSPQVSRLTDRIRTAEQTLEAIYEKRVGKVVKAATFAAADLPAEAEGMTKEEAALFETLVDEIEQNRARVLDQLTGDHADAHGGTADSTPAREASGDDTPDAAVGAADLMGGEDGDATPRAPPEPPSPDGSSGDEADDATPTDATPGDPGSDEADAGADGTGPDVDDGDATNQDAESSAPTDTGADAESPSVDRQLVRITDDVGPILGVDEREYDLATDDVVTLPAANAEPLVERGAAERLE